MKKEMRRKCQPHPVKQVHIANNDGVWGHPNVRRQHWQAVAKDHYLSLPTEWFVFQVHWGLCL